MTDDDDVGFRKPPKKHQYKEGQSGNPGGRPKGSKNLKTDLLEELSEKIQVREGDREVKISKQRALIKSLMARALKGNDRAAAKLLDLLLKVNGIEDEKDDMENPLSAEEREILKYFEERILQRRKNADSDEEEETS